MVEANGPAHCWMQPAVLPLSSPYWMLDLLELAGATCQEATFGFDSFFLFYFHKL